VKSPVSNFKRLQKLSKFDEQPLSTIDSDGQPLNPNNRQPITNNPGEASDIIWALRDVSFDVKKGEVLGIIGGNGAGKSTLLKILSRITEPTIGRAGIEGRVASLLEVGTGFHLELTGRENVYLNGTILGMKKTEIDQKFDEIIDFSGVEKFIDTPVKRYSSGMNVRLAFSVAAHLEPQILLVDEVLAVGDVEFQKKCLGKMDEVSKQGRTVLLVSHNMSAVQNLCSRSILLENGQIRMNGPTDKAVALYLSQKTLDKAIASASEIETRMEGVIRKKDPWIRFRQIEILNSEGERQRTFESDEQITVVIMFNCFKSLRDLRIGVYISDEKENSLLSTHSTDDPETTANFHKLVPGVYKAVCSFPPDTFGSKTFFVTVHLELPKDEHLIASKILGFDVVFKGYNNMYGGEKIFFRPKLRWHMTGLGKAEAGNHV